METVVQTPPSYTRSGTGHRNPSQPGPSGFSSHQRRGQVASATSAGYGRGRNVSSEGGGWAPRKRRGSFGMNSGAGGNGPGVGWGGSNGGGDSNNNTSHNNNSNNTNNNTNNSNNNNSNNSSNNRFKRRKRQHPDIVLPTKFMLGGSITDPLNLRSLENEEVNRLANQTPVASPAPAAGGGSERVEVIIPRDIKDPLNLNAPEPPAMEASSEQRSQQLNTSTSANDGKRNRDNSTNSKSSNSQLQTKKNRRRRNRNHHQHGRFTGSGLSWRAGAGPSGSNNWSPTGPAGGYDIADKYQSAHSGRGRGVRSNKNNINSNDNVGQNKSLAKTTTAEDKTDNTNNSGGCSSSNNGKNTTAASTGANVQNNANVSDSSNNNNNNNNNNSNSTTKNNVSGDGKKSSANQRFRYGNYNRYYGYRNGTEADSRLSLLKRKWFENKVCLDIGCNVGHVTLSVARDYGPREIIGMDIDQTLIRIARKNVRHYVHEENVQGSWFPESCAITFGPIAIAPVRVGASGGGTSYRSTNMPEVDGGSANHRRGGGPGASNRDGAASTNSSYTGLPVPFPYNIFFTRGNYVLDTDELLETQREEFDTIMCLSTSKWIQLNFGDEGLKRTFKRVFRQLRPGGRFLFEPQPLSSYHKFCAPEHRENFRQMQLKPDEFPDYLTREVGFASCRILGVGNHGAKNFQRPLYLLRKAKTEKTPMQGNSDNGQSRNTPNSSPAGQGNKTSERTDPFKDERNKDPSISRSFEAPPSQPSLPRPSPAHECDTTTASI